MTWITLFLSCGWLVTIFLEMLIFCFLCNLHPIPECGPGVAARRHSCFIFWGVKQCAMASKHSVFTLQWNGSHWCSSWEYQGLAHCTEEHIQFFPGVGMVGLHQTHPFSSAWLFSNYWCIYPLIPIAFSLTGVPNTTPSNASQSPLEFSS